MILYVYTQAIDFSFLVGQVFFWLNDQLSDHHIDQVEEFSFKLLKEYFATSKQSQNPDAVSLKKLGYIYMPSWSCMLSIPY